MKRIHPFLIAALAAAALLAGCVVATPAPEATPEPTAEATLTPVLPLPTSTEAPTQPPTETPEPEPTAAPTLPEPTVGTSSVDASATPIPIRYALQSGTPLFMQAFAHADQGCAWMGVAGQVFDSRGAPQTGVVINVGGLLDGDPVDVLAVSGGAPAYGPAGFEVQLPKAALASSQALWITVHGPQGELATERIHFDTSADCKQNLVLINFRQAAGSEEVYLPGIYR